MLELDSVVMVVDDDDSFRSSTERLIRSMGLLVRCFSSAADFLSAKRPDAPACVVLDVRMPGLGGLDLQREMARVGIRIPLIFVTGHGDVPTSVKAMKGGAVEFLTKPFRDQDLLDAIAQALSRDRARRLGAAKLELLQRHYDLLTNREREVMKGVVSGLLNKQIAAELGTAEKTIKFHRSHVMKKMEVVSLAALVQMAGHLREGLKEGNPPMV